MYNIDCSSDSNFAFFGEQYVHFKYLIDSVIYREEG